MKRIYGMSKNRKDLAAWIEDRTFPVMCAIAQLYLFPNVTTRAHWRIEVWEKLHEMKLFKHNNKLPDAEFIYANSWGIDEEYVSDAITWAISHENLLTPIAKIDKVELHDIMSDYFSWLSQQLSKHRAVHINDVAEKLDELGLTV